MAESRKVLLMSLFAVALAVAPRVHAQQQQVETALPDTRRTKKSHLFSPDTTHTPDEPNARENSPTANFWGEQTQQGMNANIEVEKERRKIHGWNGESGNVLNAMAEIKKGAKEGDYVDAGELKEEADAARSKLIMQEEESGMNSLEKLKEQRKEGLPTARKGIAKPYVDAVVGQKEKELSEKRAREEKRMGELKDEGNFLRRHPKEG